MKNLNYLVQKLKLVLQCFHMIYIFYCTAIKFHASGLVKYFFHKYRCITAKFLLHTATCVTFEVPHRNRCQYISRWRPSRFYKICILKQKLRKFNFKRITEIDDSYKHTLFSVSAVLQVLWRKSDFAFVNKCLCFIAIVGSDFLAHTTWCNSRKCPSETTTIFP